MNKHTCLFAALTIGLLTFAGCTPHKPDAAKMDKPVSAGSEPTGGGPEAPAAQSPAIAPATPPCSEPNTAEPNVPVVAHPEPNATDTDTPQVHAVQVPPPEPNQPMPAEPNAPGQAEPNGAPPAESNVASAAPVPEKGSAEPNKPEPAQPQSAPTIAPDANEPKVSPATLFHDRCAEILRSFVKEDGLVDYIGLRRKRLELKRLLSDFDNLDPNQYNSWSREDKIALWINAYNIQMLGIIADNYPIKSSRILSLYWGPYSIQHIKGIWTDYKLMVMDEEFTLAEIEKRFSTKEFADPRIYFALAYASLSGPPLRNEPYYGHKLNEQLEDQVRRFLTAGNCLRIDRNRKVVYLSAIFQSAWRGKEFWVKFATDKKFKAQMPDTRAVLNFLTNYIPEEDVSFLEVGNYSLEHIKYDWTVNDISKRP